MTETRRTNSQLDRELRRLLAGSRLVCELSLDDDLLLEVKMAWTFTRMPKDELVRKYPAIGAVFLADWGVHKYHDNEYWKELDLAPAEQNRTGEAFLTALTTLDLETFPQFRAEGEKARRFLAPILAHGGIPASLAHDFLTDVLFTAVRHAPGATGAELVARWRREPPRALTTTVSRFILYGGKTAVDLVDRLIGLAAIPRVELAAGAEVGVPRHIVRAYLTVPEADVPKPRPTLPRPTIELDPWGDEGPVLRLPPLVREVGESLTWTIEDGSGIAKVERAYPRRDLAPLPLFPADEWVVSGRRNGETVFERTFECFGDDRMLCFDDNRTYLADVEGIKADAAWVVTRRGVQLASLEADGQRSLEGEMTRFSGAWSQHKAVRVDLSSVDMLLALDGDEEIGRVPVRRATAAHPEFAEPPMRDLHSQEGLAVRSALPSIILPARGTWTVRVSGPAGTSAASTVTTGDLPSRVDLADVVGTAPMGRWNVSVTGSLGSDFRDAFVLVPELTLGTPADPLSPGTGEVGIEMRTASRDLRFPGRGPGEPYTLGVPAHETHGEVWVFSRDHDAKVGLLVAVPRIQWAFRAGAVVPRMASDVISFEPADLGAELPALLVSVGRPDVPVRLLLEDAEGDRLLLAGAGRTTPDGLFRFDLAGLRDTARAKASDGLRLDLFVGSTSVLVGYHLPAEQGKPAPAAGGVSIFDREFQVRVVEVRPHSLMVTAEDMNGVIYEEQLPKPLSAYKLGDTLAARIVSIGQIVKFDARTFDPTAFGVGEVLEGIVAKVQGDGLIVHARGHDLRVDPQRLPPDRPARTWRLGERVTGKVVGITPARRKIRFSVAPFNGDAVHVGDQVDAHVFFAADVILATVDGLVGYIRNENRPPQQVRTGDVIRARVIHIDTRRDQIDLTCRAFNPMDFVVGTTAWGDITGISEHNAWVRLRGGEVAWVPLDDTVEQEYVAGQGIGARVDVRITTVDRKKGRIAAQVLMPTRPSGASESDGPHESPFANLASLKMERE